MDNSTFAERLNNRMKEKQIKQIELVRMAEQKGIKLILISQKILELNMVLLKEKNC